MYEISKEFHFSASHILHHLEPDHPCGRLHGHNYRVIVTLRGKTLNKAGFVRDYGELSPIKSFIDATYDHRHLNDKISRNPSAENLAREIFKRFKGQFPELYSVTVCETPKTKATYYE